MAFTNEQHRKRYAEDPQHRENKLAANRAYRMEHRERLNELWRERWRSNAAYRERHALTRLARIYGLSAAQYRRLLKKQKGLCAICKRPPRRLALCVDHCPVTKRVRGLLCNNCNTGLGLFGDDPAPAARRGGLSLACAPSWDAALYPAAAGASQTCFRRLWSWSHCGCTPGKIANPC